MFTSLVGFHPFIRRFINRQQSSFHELDIGKKSNWTERRGRAFNTISLGATISPRYNSNMKTKDELDFRLGDALGVVPTELLTSVEEFQKWDSIDLTPLAVVPSDVMDSTFGAKTYNQAADIFREGVRGRTARSELLSYDIVPFGVRGSLSQKVLYVKWR